MVQGLIDRFGLSIRRVCRLVGLGRSSRAYQPQPESKADENLRKRMKEWAAKKQRYGCPMLHLILKREKLVINHRRTERIYREEKLSLKIRKRPKKVSELRVEISVPNQPNERWDMYFIHFRLANGRWGKSLTIIDECSRQSPAIETAHCMPGRKVVEVLNCLKETPGLPRVIGVDNGPEFSGKALDEWAYWKKPKQSSKTGGSNTTILGHIARSRG